MKRFIVILLLLTSTLRGMEQKETEQLPIEPGPTSLYEEESKKALLQLKEVGEDDNEILVDEVIVPWSFIKASPILQGFSTFYGLEEGAEGISTITLYTDNVPKETISIIKQIYQKMALGADFTLLLSAYVNQAPLEHIANVLFGLDYLDNKEWLESLITAFKERLIQLAQNNEWEKMNTLFIQVQDKPGIVVPLVNLLVDYLCLESSYLRAIYPSLKVKKTSTIILDLKNVVFNASTNWRCATLSHIVTEFDKTLQLFTLEENKIIEIIKRKSPNIGFIALGNSILAAIDKVSGDWYHNTFKFYNLQELITTPVGLTLPEPKGVDLKTGLHLEKVVEQFICSSDGKLLLISMPPDLVFINIKAEKPFFVIRNFSMRGEHFVISPSNNVVAYTDGIDNSDIMLYDIDKNVRTKLGKHTITPIGNYNSKIIALQFSPDGTKLASVANNGIIKVWDMVLGKELCTLNGDIENCARLAELGVGILSSIQALLCFSSDNKWLISGFSDGDILNSKKVAKSREIKIWEVASGNLLTTINVNPTAKTYINGIQGLSVSSDNKNIAYIIQLPPHYAGHGLRSQLIVQQFSVIGLAQNLRQLTLRSIMLLWFCLATDAQNKPIRFDRTLEPYFFALPKELQGYFKKKSGVRNVKSLLVGAPVVSKRKQPAPPKKAEPKRSKRKEKETEEKE